MIVKVHIANERKIVAVCDKDLLGKKFEDGDLQMDLSSDFFKGKEMLPEQLEKEISNANVVNFVGKESVDFAIKKNIVQKEKVITIAGIPNAQGIIL